MVSSLFLRGFTQAPPIPFFPYFPPFLPHSHPHKPQNHHHPNTNQHERQTLITPPLRTLASLTLYSLLKSLLLLFLGLITFAGVSWWLFVLARERSSGNVEREGNEDADEALKELEGKDGEGDEKKKDKKKKGKKEGKKKDGKDGEEEGKDGK